MGTLQGQRPPGLKFRAPVQDPAAFGRLSPEEVEAIRKQARLKVEDELKDAEERQLLAQFMAEERRAHDPKEELHPIYLDLAPSMPWIMLDGTQYLPHTLYHVNSKVYAVLLEQMNRGWAHEEITQVRSESGYSRRPPSYVGVGNFMGDRSPRGMRISAGAMAGAVGQFQSMMNP